MRWHVLLAVAALIVSPVRADFSDGLEAYDAGRYADALTAWRELAAQGHLDSMVAIAGLYAAGTGVPLDYREAARWYRRAADCGHAIAQLNLGDFYSRGRGVDQDPVLAAVYLSRAAAQGNAWAKDRRDAVRATMSAAEKAEAEKRLSEKILPCGVPAEPGS